MKRILSALALCGALSTTMLSPVWAQDAATAPVTSAVATAPAASATAQAAPPAAAVPATEAAASAAAPAPTVNKGD